MSTWREERRADRAADAAEHRNNIKFQAEMARDERRADRDEKRADDARRRRERAQRRQARAARREKALTPGNIYRKGTLALVAASALASLPAQIAHFTAISIMLLPIPFALEGAAWVMNAGVAYADEKRLPLWVRWVLRALAMSAALFAASINYDYGTHLKGLSPDQQTAAGLGLAAVTMGGPLFFEVRQWVTTLSVASDPKRREEKRKKRHEKQRRKDHKDVVKLARKLVSAAPYNTLAFENAFATAWEIKYGTQSLGMTPKLHGAKLSSRKAYTAAMDAANGSPVSIRGRLIEALHPAPVMRTASPKKPQVVTDLPPASEKPAKGGRRKPPPHRRSKGDSLPFHPLAKVAAADTARQIPAVNGHHH